jgi:GT2 family glycosyltransferase
MKEPLVSVVIPTFDRAYCVARTIQSALDQTHQNLEVLVVDDGSTDGTKDLIHRSFGSNPRVRYHYQKNEGVCSARNQGFAMAKGEYIALLDSDDIWFPWKLELQLACFAERKDVGMVWSDMEALDVNGKLIGKTYLRRMYHAWEFFPTMESLFGPGVTLPSKVGNTGATLPGATFYSGNIFSSMFLGNMVHTSTTLLTRERLEKINGFNLALNVTGEDFDFHLRTAQAGPVGLLNISTMTYQTGMADQLTRPEYFSYVAINLLKTLKPYLESAKGIDLPPRMIQQRWGQVYQWIADAYLHEGNRPEGRRNLLYSLKHDPWRTKPWKLLAVSSMPLPVDKWLRRTYRKFNPRTEALSILLALAIWLNF